MNQKDLHLLTKLYLCECKRGPAAAGDFANKLTDAEAEIVYNELTAIGSKMLVRALWYNYNTQSMRVFRNNKP